jgi:hypothetical protein
MNQNFQEDILILVAIILTCAAILFPIFRPAQEYTTTPPQTVTIEGHDYFATRMHGGGFNLCHKGNCKACLNLKAEDFK